MYMSRHFPAFYSYKLRYETLRKRAISKCFQTDGGSDGRKKSGPIIKVGPCVMSLFALVSKPFRLDKKPYKRLGFAFDKPLVMQNFPQFLHFKHCTLSLIYVHNNAVFFKIESHNF